ncbi:TrkA-C domain protein [Clostridium acetireducens DSM 10703]|jgi:hypothetical protein|uniref:TrkA-C domain protein n=1 Tax=Clostridium acetireducens DSM 10703 TaxID=1121290 RepID=A0A1E8F0N3_9CLOT|nr:TrkA C-terminal domain-containing protein [Clostridium acetireducens]OFI07001.1 TrkA-C domain protein [Clostridium acetireducens DSM 10703]
MLYFLLSVIIFLLSIEIITVLFKLTGLSEEKSRFQVISLLTGSGFTTKEAELVTQHPKRRKLAQIVMLIGYIGILTSISFLVNLLRKSVSFKDLIILAIFFSCILLFLRSKPLMALLDCIIEKIILIKHIKAKINGSIYTLITRAKGYGVYSILIDDTSSLIGVPLKESNLKPHNILVLNIDKGDKFIGFPKRDYVIESGDNLLIYGKISEIIRIFNINHKKVHK